MSAAILQDLSVRCVAGSGAPRRDAISEEVWSGVMESNARIVIHMWVRPIR